MIILILEVMILNPKMLFEIILQMLYLLVLSPASPKKEGDPIHVRQPTNFLTTL